jgi:hypothetical protein
MHGSSFPGTQSRPGSSRTTTTARHLRAWALKNRLPRHGASGRGTHRPRRSTRRSHWSRRSGWPRRSFIHRPRTSLRNNHSRSRRLRCHGCRGTGRRRNLRRGRRSSGNSGPRRNRRWSRWRSNRSRRFRLAGSWRRNNLRWNRNGINRSLGLRSYKSRWPNRCNRRRYRCRGRIRTNSGRRCGQLGSRRGWRRPRRSRHNARGSRCNRTRWRRTRRFLPLRDGLHHISRTGDAG